ncbi:MAG: hypothetical protein Q8R76_06795 [Candidatus Omnitrophota bacterium]|nr:hypothetical protein [Candidatus Omnitrophota bacterium]
MEAKRNMTSHIKAWIAMIVVFTLVCYSPAIAFAEAPETSADFHSTQSNSLAALDQAAAQLGLAMYLHNQNYGVNGGTNRQRLLGELGKVTEETEAVRKNGSHVIPVEILKVQMTLGRDIRGAIKESAEHVNQGFRLGQPRLVDHELDDVMNPGWNKMSDQARDTLKAVQARLRDRGKKDKEDGEDSEGSERGLKNALSRVEAARARATNERAGLVASKVLAGLLSDARNQGIQEIARTAAAAAGNGRRGKGRPAGVGGGPPADPPGGGPPAGKGGGRP